MSATLRCALLLVFLGACSRPPAASVPHHPPQGSVEICGNGLDDDLDAKTDCDDADCEDPVACPVCGDGVRAGTEACDGDDVGGYTCASLGLGYGVLRCDDACALDPSCMFPPEDCGQVGDEDYNGVADCFDPTCAARPLCLHLEIVSAPREGTVTATLDPVVLQVRDVLGATRSGIAVRLEAPPGALATPAEVTSGPDGTASFVPRLGRRAAKQVFVASIEAEVIPLEIEARDAADGTVHTVLGTADVQGNDAAGAAIGARIGRPRDVEVAADGTLYVAEDCRVLVVSPDGVLSVRYQSADCTTSSVARLALDEPRHALYFSDPAAGVVRALDLAAGPPTIVAGGGTLGPVEAEAGLATAIRLAIPGDLLLVGSELYVVDGELQRVFRVDLEAHSVITVLQIAVAGFGGCEDAEVAVRDLNAGSVLAGPPGVPFVAGAICGSLSHATGARPVAGLVRLDPAGLAHIAGVADGIAPPFDAHVPFRTTRLDDAPHGAFDRGGNLFAFVATELVRVDAATQEALRIAGGFGPAGELLPLAETRFTSPGAMAFDPRGDAYFPDAGSFTVRRIVGLGSEARTGVDIAVAREGGFEVEMASRLSGDVAPVRVHVSAEGRALAGSALDLKPDPDLTVYGRYVTDGGGDAVLDVRAGLVAGPRTIVASLLDLHGQPAAPTPIVLDVLEPEPGSLFTFMGMDDRCEGDDYFGPEPAPSRQCLGVLDLAPASDGTVFVAASHRVFRLRTDGLVELVAGIGDVFPPVGDTGNGGPAVEAHVAAGRLALDEARGRLYLMNERSIRFVDLTTGVIDAFATGLNMDSIDVRSNGAVVVAAGGQVLELDGETGAEHLLLDRGEGRCFTEPEPVFRFARSATSVGDVVYVAGGTCGGADVIGAVSGDGSFSIVSAPEGSLDDGVDFSEMELFIGNDLSHDPDGNLVFADHDRVRRVRLDSGLVETIAGKRDSAGPISEHGAALESSIAGARVAAVGADGRLWIVTPGGDAVVVW